MEDCAKCLEIVQGGAMISAWEVGRGVKGVSSKTERKHLG